MSARDNRASAATADCPADILDRAHLARYTMENPELEREIIDLFLQQLPATLAMLREAHSLSDWKLATHTLKGSAAAIGATEINGLAAALERCAYAAGGSGNDLQIAAIEAAATRFREAVLRIFG